MLAVTNPELKSFEDLAHSFAHKELFAGRESNDRYPFGPFFDSVVAKAYEVGLLSATLPEACGGIGQGMSALCVILEHICSVDANLGGIIFTHALAQEIMLAAGEQGLLSSVIENAADYHEALIAYTAFDNPTEIQTLPEAYPSGDGYILSGKLDYVVLAGIAGHALVPARIQGQEESSFFLIDGMDAGLAISAPIFSLGLHACPAVDLSLSKVKGVCVGQEGRGRLYFEIAADHMHAAAAAMECGIMQGSYQEALDYSHQRFQGGWEIINWSGLRMLLAEMAVQAKIARMVVSEAALSVEQQLPEWRIASRAAALHLADLACSLTTDGIQVLGGNGYMKDYGQEKRFRDAKQVQALLGMAPLRKLGMVSTGIPHPEM